MPNFRSFLVTSTLLLNFSVGIAHAKAPAGYSLVWSDEFKTPAVDTNEWKFREGPGSHSYQQAQNVTIQQDGLHIAENQEEHGKFQYTGGGVITKRTWRYGYFETLVKAGGSGWHEAFWSTGTGADDKNNYTRDGHTIEIDCMEHDRGGWPQVQPNGLSLGVINWLPTGKEADLYRRFPNVPFDLSRGFHTFGFECQPGFIRFYIDGQAVGISDMRDFTDISDHIVWLSAIATHDNAQTGEAVFKYLRIYAADRQTQNQRCREAYAELDATRGKTKSKGTDLWIDAVTFTNTGGWTNDMQQGEKCLIGHRGKSTVQSESALLATTQVQVPAAGKYQLWVRSYEPESAPHGARFFNLELGSVKPNKAFGKSENPGWNWESGGTYNLPAGPVTLRLYDSSAYFARAGRILLTIDLNFAPEGIGGRDNATCN